MNNSSILILAPGLLFLGLAFVLWRTTILVDSRPAAASIAGGLSLIGAAYLVTAGMDASDGVIAWFALAFFTLMLAGLWRLENAVRRLVADRSRELRAQADQEKEMHLKLEALLKANEEWPEAYARLEKAVNGLESIATEANARASDATEINGRLIKANTDLASANEELTSECARLKSECDRLAGENENLGLAAGQLQQIVEALDQELFEQKIDPAFSEISPQVVIVTPSSNATTPSADVAPALDNVAQSLARLIERLARSRSHRPRFAVERIPASGRSRPRTRTAPVSLRLLERKISGEQAWLFRKITELRRQVESARKSLAPFGSESRPDGERRGAGESEYILRSAETETATTENAATLEREQSPVGAL